MVKQLAHERQHRQGGLRRCAAKTVMMMTGVVGDSFPQACICKTLISATNTKTEDRDSARHAACCLLVCLFDLKGPLL